LGLEPAGIILALFQRESAWNPNNHGDFSNILNDDTSFGYGQLRVEIVQDCIDSKKVSITSVSGLTSVNDSATRAKLKNMNPQENIACALYQLEKNSISSINYFCSLNGVLDGGPDVSYTGIAASLRRHNGEGCLLNAGLYPQRYIPSSNYYAWDFVPAVVKECEAKFSKYGCDISNFETVKTPATKGQSVSYYT